MFQVDDRPRTIKKRSMICCLWSFAQIKNTAQVRRVYKDTGETVN